MLVALVALVALSGVAAAVVVLFAAALVVIWVKVLVVVVFCGVFAVLVMEKSSQKRVKTWRRLARMGIQEMTARVSPMTPSGSLRAPFFRFSWLSSGCACAVVGVCWCCGVGGVGGVVGCCGGCGGAFCGGARGDLGQSARAGVFCGVFAVLVMEKSSRKSSQNVAATGSDGHPGDDCEGQSNDAFG